MIMMMCHEVHGALQEKKLLNECAWYCSL